MQKDRSTLREGKITWPPSWGFSLPSCGMEHPKAGRSQEETPAPPHPSQTALLLEKSRPAALHGHRVGRWGQQPLPLLSCPCPTSFDLAPPPLFFLFLFSRPFRQEFKVLVSVWMRTLSLPSRGWGDSIQFWGLL